MKWYKFKRVLRRFFFLADFSPFWYGCAAFCGLLFVGCLNYTGDNLLVMFAMMASSLVAAALCVSLAIAAKMSHEARWEKIDRKRQAQRAKHTARLRRFQQEMHALRQSW